jgi:hypothetical protein
MERNVKIYQSPFHPAMEIVDKLVINLFAPYSDDFITIQCNSNLVDYKENADQKNIKVRQINVTVNTPDTKTVRLDFKEDNVKDVEIDNTIYTIKLMGISKEKIQNQHFPVFEFYITWE